MESEQQGHVKKKDKTNGYYLSVLKKDVKNNFLKRWVDVLSYILWF